MLLFFFFFFFFFFLWRDRVYFVARRRLRILRRYEGRRFCEATRVADFVTRRESRILKRPFHWVSALGYYICRRYTGCSGRVSQLQAEQILITRVTNYTGYSTWSQLWRTRSRRWRTRLRRCYTWLRLTLFEGKLLQHSLPFVETMILHVRHFLMIFSSSNNNI